MCHTLAALHELHAIKQETAKKSEKCKASLEQTSLGVIRTMLTERTSQLAGELNNVGLSKTS